MKTRSTHVAAAILLPVAAAVLFAGPVDAQRRPPPVVSGTTPAPVVNAGSLSPKARGDLTEQFVAKWGNYVARVYDIAPKTWAMRMVPTFVNADPANFKEALGRDTFEGAMLALSGTAHRLSDDQIVDGMARSGSLTDPDSMRDAGAKALGSLSQDLVYTPVQPCRIVDTRNTAPGEIAQNGIRNFVGMGLSSYAGQGGSATNCGMLGANATALALNVTAVSPNIAGYATVFPYGTTQPTTASVNYVAGAVVNNGIIAQVPNPLSTYDFTIYSFARAHYVVDVVGYFAPPAATPLECNHTFATSSVAANAIFDVAIPNCAAGYTLVGAGCRTPGFADADWAINGLFQSTPSQVAGYCSGRNKTAASITVQGVGRCCRVPGR